MRAEPFHALPEAEADRRFGEALDKIKRQRAATPATHPAHVGAETTDGMPALRAKDLAARRAVYLRDRIADQRGWYPRKASESKGRRSSPSTSRPYSPPPPRRSWPGSR